MLPANGRGDFGASDLPAAASGALARRHAAPTERRRGEFYG
jgi:hypothetical protein